MRPVRFLAAALALVAAAAALGAAPARAGAWVERPDLSLGDLYDHLTVDDNHEEDPDLPNWYGTSSDLHGSMALSGDGRSLYQLDHVDEALRVFAVTPETGALELVQTVAGVTVDVREVWKQYGRSVVRGGLVVADDGLAVFVSTVDGLFPSVIPFARDPGSGALTRGDEVQDPARGSATAAALGKQCNTSALALARDGVSLVVAHGETTATGFSPSCLSHNPNPDEVGHGPHMFELARRAGGAPDGGSHFEDAGTAQALLQPLATLVAGASTIDDRIFATASPYRCGDNDGRGEAERSLFVTLVPGDGYRYLRHGEGEPDEGELITSEVPSHFSPERLASGLRGDAPYRLLRASPDGRFLYASPLNGFNTDPARVQTLAVLDGEPGIPEPIADESECAAVVLPMGGGRAAPRAAEARGSSLFDGVDTACPRAFVRADPRRERYADWAADQAHEDPADRAMVTDLCVSRRWVVAAVRSSLALAKTETAAGGASANGDYEDMPRGADPTRREYGHVVVFERDAGTGALVHRQSVGGMLRPAAVACSDTAAWVAGPRGVRVLQFVEDRPRNLAYPPLGAPLVAGVPLAAPLVPALDGAADGGFAVSPPLPDGLVFDEATGAVSGQVNAFETAEPRQHVVVARNSGGVAATVLRLEVVDTAPPCDGWAGGEASVVVVAGSAVSLAWGDPAAAAAARTEFSLLDGSAALPPGLVLDAATGAIRGTPLEPADEVTVFVRCSNSGGGNSQSLGLKVAAAPLGTLRYDTPEAVYRVGEPVRAAVPFFEGAPASAAPAGLSFAHVPSGLPDGLAFDASTGVVSGTPTFAAARTVYTVTATSGDGGEASADVHITVLPAPPSPPVYASPVRTLRPGVLVSPPLVVTAPTGATLYTVDPPLPEGLEFSSATGAVLEAALAPAPAAAYTVTASNAGGSATATLVLRVATAEPASVEYAVSAAVAVRGLALEPALEPAVLAGDGGAPLTFSVAPPLPAGLSLDGGTGVIAGTVPAGAGGPPAGVSLHTVTASYDGGSLARSVQIEVRDTAPEALAYTAAGDDDDDEPRLVAGGDAPVELRVGEPVPEGLLLARLEMPGDGSGTLAAPSFRATPGLPPGLSVDAATGEIRGTPQAVGSGRYRVEAATAAGAVHAEVHLSVVAEPPAGLSYAGAPGAGDEPLVLRVGQRLEPRLAATLATRGEGESPAFEVSPALPPGVGLCPRTGEIAGTPQVAVVDATYTVTARNSGGAASAAVRLLVRHADPAQVLALQYATHEMVLSEGDAVRPNTPVAVPCPFDGCPAGAVFEVDPRLPRGFRLNVDTGVITGTAPPSPRARTRHVVTQGGNEAVVFVTVLPLPPVFVTYGGSALVLTAGVAAAPADATPELGGTAPFAWEVTPALPAGLELDAATGAIGGTPGGAQARRTYVVTARNLGGSAEARVELEVRERPPALADGAAELSAADNATLAGPRLADGSGPAEGWTVSPPLPPGFAFDAATGAVTSPGGAAGAVTSYTYTVCAVNTGGEACRDVLLVGAAELASAANATRAIQTTVTTMEGDTTARRASIASLFLVFGIFFVALLLLLVWRVWQPDAEALDVEMEALEDVDDKWQRNLSRRALEEEQRAGVAASSSRADLELEGN